MAIWLIRMIMGPADVLIFLNNLKTMNEKSTTETFAMNHSSGHSRLVSRFKGVNFSIAIYGMYLIV